MKYSILVLLSLATMGCEVYRKKITESYYLNAIESKYEMTINFISKEGIIIGVMPPTVYAIGYNDQFIIAKQHPYDILHPPNKAITNFFIIPIQNPVSISKENNVIGPLTKIGFRIKRKDLHIPDDLGFTIVFRDLE